MSEKKFIIPPSASRTIIAQGATGVRKVSGLHSAQHGGKLVRMGTPPTRLENRKISFTLLTRSAATVSPYFFPRVLP